MAVTVSAESPSDNKDLHLSPPTPAEDIIYRRRTVRKFQPDKVPRELIERLLSAAIQAPSASNKQPWRFFVIESTEKRNELHDAVESTVESIREVIPPDFRDSFENYGNYFVRFVDAPCVIAVAFSNLVTLSHMIDNNRTTLAPLEIEKMEMYSGLISASLAIQNLLLCADSLGLGASCMTGPLVARTQLKAILEIPESWDLAALLCVGYPAENPASQTRKNLNHVVRWETNNR